MANRAKGFGMSAAIKGKIDSKYDPVQEAEAREYIESMSGCTIQGELHEGLHDGIILCKMMNNLVPGSIPKINESKMAFKMMENIGQFLKACENYGCATIDLFQTVDLYENQNMPQVVGGIHALGRKAQSKGQPGIGPAEAAENKREFTDEQLKEGQSVIGLQMGYNKGASQSGSTAYGTGRQINK